MNRQNKTINIHEKTEFSLKQRTPDVNQLLQRNKLAAEQAQHNNCIKQILDWGMAMQSTEDEDEDEDS